MLACSSIRLAVQPSQQTSACLFVCLLSSAPVVGRHPTVFGRPPYLGGRGSQLISVVEKVKGSLCGSQSERKTKRPGRQTGSSTRLPVAVQLEGSLVLFSRSSLMSNLNARLASRMQTGGGFSWLRRDGEAKFSPSMALLWMSRNSLNLNWLEQVLRSFRLLGFILARPELYLECEEKLEMEPPPTMVAARGGLCFG